jgi:hypothetical protein
MKPQQAPRTSPLTHQRPTPPRERPRSLVLLNTGSGTAAALRQSWTRSEDVDNKLVSFAAVALETVEPEPTCYPVRRREPQLELILAVERATNLPVQVATSFACGSVIGTMSRASLVVPVVGVVLLTVATALPNVRFGDSSNRGDTPLYRQYGENMLQGKLPYRDFFDEYPPGALPVFVLPAAMPGASFTFWSKAVQWLLAAACIVFAAVMLRTGRWRAAFIGLTPALLGKVTFTRFDFWPAALTAASLAAILARRHRIALALLAIAVAAKVYPAVLLPPFLLVVDRRMGRRETKVVSVIFAAVLAAIVLPFAAVGPGGVRYSLDIQFRRPLQVESLGGSFLLVLHRLGAYTPHVVSSYGSQNLAGGVASAFGVLTTLAALVAIVAVWALFARSPRDDRTLLAAAAASVLAFVAFGKVLSPQYLIWLVPLLPAALGRWRLALLGAAVGLTQVWSQGRYHEVVAGRSIVWFVFARDIVLVALYLLIAATVTWRAPEPSTAMPAAQSVNNSGRLA